MCRGCQPNDRERLKIKAFYIHLSFSSLRKELYDSLTLHLLPRINGGPLEIDGLIIRPDTPGFITLHRVVSSDVTMGGAIYGSREKLRVSEGSRFEVYAPDGKVLKGCFRKDEGENWKLDCSSQLEGEQVEFLEEVDVCVEVDGHAAAAVMTEKVKMAERRKRGRCFQGLEEIPEVEREVEWEGCCCRCCCCDCNGNAGRMMDGADCEMEVEMDGVRWAVDVGIWVMCLGVGYLVSKASCMRISRQRRLF